LELAAATADGKTFSSLVAPLTAINDDAAAVTGLNWEAVKNQPPLPVVLLEWVRWLQQQCVSSPGGSSTLVLMGHNINRCDPTFAHLSSSNLPRVCVRCQTASRMLIAAHADSS
jgi:hypothetical protein